MTFRAVVLGLLAAVALSALGYFNDHVLKLTYVVGNFFPILVFGGMVVFLMVVNPLLRLLGLAFSRKEVATVVVLMLAACCIPSSGLLRTFTIQLAMPANLANNNLSWQRYHLVELVPDQMLATKHDDQRVVGKMVSGMGKGETTIGIRQVPWEMEPIGRQDEGEPAKPKAAGPAATQSVEGALATAPAEPVAATQPATQASPTQPASAPAVVAQTGDSGPGGPVEEAGWARPLKFWLPLIALAFVGLLALALVVHRQWSSNELLRYPIVEFAAGVMEREPGKLLVKVFYNKLFWTGLAVAFVVHLVNGYYVYNEHSIQIPLSIDMSAALRDLWPNLEKTDRSWGVSGPRLFITVAAFSYLLSSDIGLSLGICNLVFCVTAATFIAHGVDITDDYMMGGIFNYQVFGSYLGMALIILYGGRNFYWGVLKRAFGARAPKSVPHYSVWGARVFIFCMTAATIWLWKGGLDVYLAVLVMLMVCLMLLVIGRINAETGLFFIQPAWPIVGVITCIFGMEALGPKMFVIIGLVVIVLAADPRESIMPFILNGLKLGEKVDVRPSRAAPWMGVALLLGLAAGVPCVLWAQYNWGTNYSQDDWMTRKVPSFTFQSAAAEMDKLHGDAKTNAGKHEGLSRFAHLKPKQDFLVAAGIGLAIVLLLNTARLRFVWWPIHPVLFLVWSSVPMAHFAPSFLLGWIVRSLTVKLTGGGGYQKLKPLMYGLIAGDLLGGLLFMGVGARHYWMTGTKPKLYQIFPQ